MSYFSIPYNNIFSDNLKLYEVYYTQHRTSVQKKLERSPKVRLYKPVLIESRRGGVTFLVHIVRAARAVGVMAFHYEITSNTHRASQLLAEFLSNKQ